jgi:hypothetical protein
MKGAAQRLNVTTHKVADVAGQWHSLSSCVDLEVHRGHDGRLYLLDAARCLPPTTPLRNIKGCNLYRLFRPEFVAQHSVALCPDAYGGWPLEGRAEHELHINAATHSLLTSSVERLAGQLDEVEWKGAVAEEGSDLCALVHRGGVNLRYLGLLACGVRTAAARVVLLTEVVARTVKSVVWGRMRAQASDSCDAHHTVAIAALNALFLEPWSAACRVLCMYVCMCVCVYVYVCNVVMVMVRRLSVRLMLLTSAILYTGGATLSALFSRFSPLTLFFSPILFFPISSLILSSLPFSSSPISSLILSSLPFSSLPFSCLPFSSSPSILSLRSLLFSLLSL